MKLGRNDPCHCGSGKKYKACCLAKDESEERAAREKAAQTGPLDVAPAQAASARALRKEQRHAAQPWKGHANTRGFQRVNSLRKVGGS